MTTTTTKVPAKLAKFYETHLKIDESSSRAVQRVAALWLGHTDGKIESDALKALCAALGLYDYEGRMGDNNFGANWTCNMKKDAAYFDGHCTTGFKLTAVGKAEAKAIFEDGQPPTRRRVEGGAKPKSKATKKAPVKKAEPKKPAAVKAAKPEKKAAAQKKAAPAGDEAARKAAAKRRALAKKRDLSGAGSPESAPAPAPEPQAAPAS
jgi:hypothetical protein